MSPNDTFCFHKRGGLGLEPGVLPPTLTDDLHFALERGGASASAGAGWGLGHRPALAWLRSLRDAGPVVFGVL